MNFPDEVSADEMEIRRMEWELMGYVTAMAKYPERDSNGYSRVVTLVGVCTPPECLGGRLATAKPEWHRVWQSRGGVWSRALDGYGAVQLLNRSLRPGKNKPVKRCK